MSKILILKLIFLGVTLVGVIYVMTHMNEDAMSRALSAFGIEPGTRESPGLMAAGRALKDGEERMTICPNRVHSIRLERHGLTIEETDTAGGRKWVAKLDDPHAGVLPDADAKFTELNYMAVEKWFSLHCQIAIRPMNEPKANQDLGSLDPVRIKYIDGTERRFVHEARDKFFTEGSRHFESEDFADAIEELKRVAQFE